MRPIDFWFSIGSTYSYLTVMRIDTVAEQAGARIRWRPFDVRHMMKAQKNVPFADKPAKLAYMWRDIERRQARQGLAGRFPAPYPIYDLARANRVALVGLREGWGKDYIREAYRLWFEDHEMPGSDPNLPDALTAAGADVAAALEAADSPDTRAALAAATDEAQALGLFGAPSFVVDGELFWGDDRLEDALDWAAHGRLT